MKIMRVFFTTNYVFTSKRTEMHLAAEFHGDSLKPNQIKLALVP